MSDAGDDERLNAARRLADTLQSHGVSPPGSPDAWRLVYFLSGAAFGLFAGWLIWG